MNRDRIFPWKKRKDKVQKTEELQGQNSSETVTEKNDAPGAKEGKSNFVLTKNIMLVHTDEKITGGR